MKFVFDWPSGFGEDFENGGRTPTDTGASLYYKLTNQPKGSGELKKKLSNIKIPVVFHKNPKNFDT